MVIWDHSSLEDHAKPNSVPTIPTYNLFLISPKFLLQSRYSGQRETELQSLWLVAHRTTVSLMKKNYPQDRLRNAKQDKVSPLLPTSLSFLVTNVSYTCESLCHWAEQHEQSFPLRKHAADLID